MKELLFLGHRITDQGVAVDESKIAVMKNMQPPKSQKDLRRILGYFNYYRKFCKGYALIVSPFRNLWQAEGAVKFVWTAEHQAAFEKLKTAMVTAPVLAYPDNSKRYYLTTDSSTQAISYILSQKDEQGRLHPCFMGGRALTRAETRYPIQQLECLALVAGVQTYHEFIAGSPCTVLTDHLSLKFLQSMKYKQGRMGRWSLFLSNYDLTSRARTDHVYSRHTWRRRRRSGRQTQIT
jgi:hypothetical protein